MDERTNERMNDWQKIYTIQDILIKDFVKTLNKYHVDSTMGLMILEGIKSVLLEDAYVHQLKSVLIEKAEQEKAEAELLEKERRVKEAMDAEDPENYHVGFVPVE